MDIICNAFLNLIFSLIKHPTLRVILRPQLPGEKFAFYFGDPSHVPSADPSHSHPERRLRFNSRLGIASCREFAQTKLKQGRPKASASA